MIRDPQPHLALHRREELGGYGVMVEGLWPEEALVDQSVEDLDLHVQAGELRLGRTQCTARGKGI